MKIEPHCASTKDMPHEGEEFGYILEGTALLHIGKKSYSLQKNEAFYFVSNRVHFIENTTDEPIKLLWISSPPTF